MLSSNKDLVSNFLIFVAGFFALFLVFFVPLVYYMSPHIAAYTYDWAVLLFVMAFFAISAYIGWVTITLSNASETIPLATIGAGVVALVGVLLMTMNDGDYVKYGIAALMISVVIIAGVILWQAVPLFNKAKLTMVPLYAQGLLALGALIFLGLTYTNVF